LQQNLNSRVGFLAERHRQRGAKEIASNAKIAKDWKLKARFQFSAICMTQWSLVFNRQFLAISAIWQLLLTAKGLRSRPV
jgi:hypothetical protein